MSFKTQLNIELLWSYTEHKKVLEIIPVSNALLERCYVFGFPKVLEQKLLLKKFLKLFFLTLALYEIPWAIFFRGCTNRTFCTFCRPFFILVVPYATFRATFWCPLGPFWTICCKETICKPLKVPSLKVLVLPK